METELNNKIYFDKICSIELLEYISYKSEYPEEAEFAFIEFCRRFEKNVIQKAEIYSSKFGYSEVVALEIANCTFGRVWKYPSFTLKKAKSKDIEKAILLWLYPIMYTQLVKYGEQNTCAEPSIDEDLSIITDLDELVNKMSDSDDIKHKKDLKIKLEMLDSAFIGLSEKQKIIYLTYKAYEVPGKNIPRSISKKLQETLELTQGSIRLYKREANLHVENYIAQRNGR
ncbi:MAG: RNA polymerase subunit sigma [Flavobacterium sp.]|jgi:hypothetical protein